jgi:hypothetical protein
MMDDNSVPKATAPESLTPEEQDELGRKKIAYSPQEVVERYEAVLESINFLHELTELDCGLDSLFKRSRSLVEIKAMHVALWKLALERSFPEEADNFFSYFMEHSSTLGKGKKRIKMQQIINIYLDLFAPQKIADFTPIARYMAEKLTKNMENQKTVLLKLSLGMRRFYQTIFDHLI